MYSAAEIEFKLKLLKPVIADKFHVSRIGYFGSYATGDQTITSDLDLLVEFTQPIGWDFFTLESFLENAFGIRVDLVTRNALKEQIKSNILNQVKFI